MVRRSPRDVVISSGRTGLKSWRTLRVVAKEEESLEDAVENADIMEKREPAMEERDPDPTERKEDRLALMTEPRLPAASRAKENGFGEANSDSEGPAPTGIGAKGRGSIPDWQWKSMISWGLLRLSTWPGFSGRMMERVNCSRENVPLWMASKFL